MTSSSEGFLKKNNVFHCNDPSFQYGDPLFICSDPSFQCGDPSFNCGDPSFQCGYSVTLVGMYIKLPTR